MKNGVILRSLFVKETRHLIFSPTTSVAYLFFALFASFPFFALGANLSAGQTAFRQWAAIVPYVSAIAVSAIAMGAWVDEKKTGTRQLILSAAIPESLPILAKFAAIYLAYLGLLALTVPIAALAPLAGNAAQYALSSAAAAITSYALLAAFGVLEVSLAIFVSTFAPNAPISFLLSTGISIILALATFDARFLYASKGILAVKDLAFYLALAFLFLFSAAWSIAPRRRRTAKKIFVGIAATALVLTASARIPARIDFNDGNARTLAPLTRETINAAQDEIKLTWYVSSAFASGNPEIGEATDTLEEYRLAGRGKVSLEIIDPKTDADKNEAKSLGLVERQNPPTAKGTSPNQGVYSGLVVECAGSSGIIPFFANNASLEYDLTRTIRELIDVPGSPRKPKKARLVFGNPDSARLYPYVSPWLAYAGFDVSELDRGTQPDRGETLIVLGSSIIDQGAADEIESFLNRGGNAVFFVSGATVNVTGNWAAEPKKPDPILRLLDRRGFSIMPRIVIDRACFRLTLPATDNSKYETVDYPFWPVTNDYPRADGLAVSRMLWSGVSSLRFFWPSPLTESVEYPASPAIVAESSRQSKAIAAPYITDPFDSQMSLLEGGEGVAASPLVECAEGAGKLVVVADEYFPSVMVDYANADENLSFLVNCVEWVSGFSDLLSLKRKSTNAIPATAAEIALVARYFSAARFVELAVVPAFIVAVSLSLFAIRRRRAP